MKKEEEKKKHQRPNCSSKHKGGSSKGLCVSLLFFFFINKLSMSNMQSVRLVCFENNFLSAISSYYIAVIWVIQCFCGFF